MISRRLIRVKILQLLYAYHSTPEASLNKVEKELFFSINKSYDLYHYLLLLLIDLVDFANSRIDIAKRKKIPTYEDLNPNTRFVENTIIEKLRQNNELMAYLNKTKLSWVNNPELIKDIFNKLIGSEFYQNYMSKPSATIDDDKKLVNYILTDIIAENDILFNILEEQSIYWNDDLEFIVSMIIKYIKTFRLNDNENKQLLRLYKNDDDIDFTKRLFRKSILWRDQTKEVIIKFTHNWEYDRIAFMDVLIMQMALTEVQEFLSIPTKVTMNEYLEIAKVFSTKNSSNFINGVLDKAFNYLRSEDKIKKSGRGLIGEDS